MEFPHVIHPGRLTWTLRILGPPWKRKIIFQTIIFRFDVNLWGCNMRKTRWKSLLTAAMMIVLCIIIDDLNIDVVLVWNRYTIYVLLCVLYGCWSLKLLWNCYGFNVDDYSVFGCDYICYDHHEFLSLFSLTLACFFSWYYTSSIQHAHSQCDLRNDVQFFGVEHVTSERCRTKVDIFRWMSCSMATISCQNSKNGCD